MKRQPNVTIKRRQMTVWKVHITVRSESMLQKTTFFFTVLCTHPKKNFQIRKTSVTTLKEKKSLVFKRAEYRTMNKMPKTNMDN